MRVYEVAREFKIDPEKLTQLLRGMGVAVRSEATTVDDVTVAKLRAKFERERRAGHGEAEEAISTVIEDVQPVKRRRRKKEDLPITETETETGTETGAAEAEDTRTFSPLKADIFTAPLAEKPKLEDLFPEKPPAPVEEVVAKGAPDPDTDSDVAPEEQTAPAPAKREITAEQKPKLRRAAEVLG